MKSKFVTMESFVQPVKSFVRTMLLTGIVTVEELLKLALYYACCFSMFMCGCAKAELEKRRAKFQKINQQSNDLHGRHALLSYTTARRQRNDDSIQHSTTLVDIEKMAPVKRIFFTIVIIQEELGKLMLHYICLLVEFIIFCCDRGWSELVETGVMDKLKDFLVLWFGRALRFKQTRHFVITGAQGKYFERFHNRLLFKFKEINNLVLNYGEVSFTYSGKGEDINSFEQELEEMKRNIQVKEVCLTEEFPSVVDFSLVANQLDLDRNILLLYQGNLEQNNDCCIIKQIMSADDLIQDETANHNESECSNNQRKTMFSLSTSCSLNIKLKGSIVKEASDVIVCIVGASKLLKRTHVGCAFLEKCGSLQTMVSEANFSDDGVYVSCVNMSGLPTVAFVQLTKWNPETSKKKLRKAVIEVLRQCDNLKCSSISFPPMGCGKAFRFPEKEVAQALIRAVKYFIDSKLTCYLKSITFLASYNMLFSKLNDTASEHFQKISISKPFNRERQLFTTSDGWEGESCPNDVKITIISMNDVKSIWKEWKKVMKNHCFHSSHFTQYYIDCWPSQFSTAIRSKAQELSVWTQRQTLTATDYLGYTIKIKGDETSVKEMKDFVESKFKSFFRHKPNYPIIHPGSPARHSLDFVQHAADSDELFPSYWAIHHNQCCNSEPEAMNIFKDVDQNVFEAIENLVLKTWRQELVGQGKDSRNIPQTSSPKIMKVQRIENTDLFERYKVSRKKLFDKASKNKQLNKPIVQTSSVQNPVETEALLPDLMKRELYTEVNEHYLFHGTKKGVIEKVTNQGLNHNVSNDAAMFGKGVYFAENATKADQYTDDRDNRLIGEELKMILARVLLGNAYRCDETHPSIANRSQRKLVQPPCTSCAKDKCSCNVDHYDSIMGEGRWFFREFIVYDNSLSYPEYLITYKRVL